MTNQLRVWKVLLALLVSMTSGAIILMALGDHAPSASAFCLSSYYELTPTDSVIASRASQSTDRWTRIEIFYSGTRVGDIAWLASVAGLQDLAKLNCHFVVCNGNGGNDGEIQVTDRWQIQESAQPAKNWYDAKTTIRICVVADGRTTHPTDTQIKRVESLVTALSRRFHINPRSVTYPGDTVP